MDSLKTLVYLIAILVLTAYSTCAYASPIDSIDVSQSDEILVGKQSVYILSEDSLSLFEAKSLLFESGRNLEVDRPVFGYTESSLWVKTVLTNRSNSSYLGVFFIGYSLLKHVDLYVLKDDSLLFVRKSGDGYSYNTRTFDGNDINFRIDLEPGETKTYILKVTSDNTLALRLELLTANKFLYKTGIEKLVFGILFGILIFAVLYNFVIYFVVRNVSYLYYVLTMFFYLCVILVLQGYGFRFIYPDITGISPVIHKAFMYLTGFFYMLLIINFLETKRYTPAINKVLKIILYSYGIGLVLLLGGFQKFSISLVLLLQLVSVPLILFTAFRIYFLGLKEAKYFIIARSLLLIAITLNFLTSLGLLDYDPILTQAHIGAAAMEAILLSFGLADKIKSLYEENEREKRNMLSQKMRADEAEYKAKTAELQVQTAELQAKAAEEESARKSLELDKAREIQLAMLPSFPPFHEKYDISAIMKTASEVGGDYYDFFEIDNKIIAAFGDASGHGLPAGIMVTITKTGLFFSDLSNFSSTMQRLNNELRKLRPKRLNMAMSLLKIDGDSDTLEYITAAMPPLFHYKKGGDSFKEYLEPGVPLGTLSKARYKPLSIKNVEDGDLVLLFSDGLVEARNNDQEEFGYERIHAIIKTEYDKTADQIIDALMSAVYQFLDHEELEDDISILVIKRS